MNNENRNLVTKVGLSTVSILAVIVLFWIAYELLTTAVVYSGEIRNFLLPFILAFILAYILKPVVDYMETKNIPRIAAVLILYAAIGGFFVLVGTRAVNTIIDEVQKLIAVAPEYTQDIESIMWQIEAWIEEFEIPVTVTETVRENIVELEARYTDELDKFVDFDSILAILTNIFGHFLSLIAFPIILFYFLKDADLIKKNLSFVIPTKFRKRSLLTIRDINRTISAYIRSQIIICGFIGLLTYLGLLILGVEFALVLGIFAGVTNIIPYFGPWLGAIPSTVVAFLQTPTLALKVVVLIVIIQQVESQIVAPQVYGKNLAIHPLAVVTVLIAGGQFFGILGMILAVPILAIIRVIIRHLALDFWFSKNES